jgi:hypothetical protein
VVKPEREREPRQWRIAAETQVDRFNKALSALKHAFLGLRREMRDMRRRETDAVRRADEFFRNLPDELPHLRDHGDDQADSTHKHRVNSSSPTRRGGDDTGS